MKKLKFVFLSFIVVGSALAQDLSRLNPQQLEMYKKYMAGKSGQSTNTTATSPENENEYERVIEGDTLNKKQVKTKTITSTTTTTTTPLDQKKEKEELKVFGSYLFTNQNLTFEPKLNIPTPPKYVLGTNDELIIDISGLYEANYKLKVSPDGVVRIPNLGLVKVSGLTMDMASNTIKNKVSKIYMGVSSGETRVNVSLGSIRSIRVTVVGEAERPGTYTLPSLATAFNALYSCGGPNEIGTMRDIKVIRAGKVIAKLDVYRFLVDGLLGDNVALQDEDIIKIDPYKVRVYMDGAVKRKAIYEGLQGESLQNLLRYAGGFADNAYRDILTTYRYAGKEKVVIDVTAKQMNDFVLHTGDSVVISNTMLDKFKNRIDITGAVKRPGIYGFEPGLTVKQLIEKANGVSEDAYLKMAFITRRRENQLPEIMGFSLGDVITGKAQDVNLQKNDSVVIGKLSDYVEKQSVAILGAVKKPGIYSFVENMNVKDLIYLAKGFTELASTDSVELVRVIKDKDVLMNTNRKTTIEKFALDKDLNFVNGIGGDILQNGDQVIIRSISGYEGIRMVRVEGEVIHPGSYNIKNKAERISDVVKRAGGFTSYAYPTGAFLIRSESSNAIEQKLNKIMQENSKNQLETKTNKSLDATMLRQSGATSVQGYTAMDSIQKKLSGSSVVDKLFVQEGVVGLNLKDIIAHPGGKYDLKLEENDIIYIPRELQTVRVLGQVLFPTIVRYDSDMGLRGYISNSGGFSLNANRSKVFVLYPNGSAKSTESFLWMRFYPKVEPGARIVVPERAVEIKNKLTPAETVAILTSISSVVALMYSILKK
ncbi:MAG: SLBB domain-containing protein [Paludibacter sp.]|nr:SLBB domain-containing protein [Paludibacter sp.]